MYDKLFLLIADLLGTYITASDPGTIQLTSKPAISRNVATDQSVVGLEVVLLDPFIEVDVFPGGAKTKVWVYEVALTQWDGKATITEAVDRITDSKLGYRYRAEPVKSFKGDNLSRYVITIHSNCPC
jgi:hypothetical protein